MMLVAPHLVKKRDATKKTMRKGYIRPAVLLELEKMADDFTHFAKKTAQLPKNSKTNKNKLHGIWERETKDLWTSSMGRGDAWDENAER